MGGGAGPTASRRWSIAVHRRPTWPRGLDRFDRVQLEDVLQVCRSAAACRRPGALLFDRSRERKKSANDADRLRKYLARFDLDWGEVKQRLPAGSGSRPDRALG